MPLIVTGARGKWDRTPKGRIHTVKYRLDACPDLGEARAVQRDGFDWAMEVLERHHNLPVRPAKAGQKSLWGKLTRARMSGELPRAPLTLQRAACAQAHTAFALREEHREAKAQKALREQDEDGVTPRTLRRLAKGPKPDEAYRRAHASKRHRRQAIHVLEGVQVNPKDPRSVRVRGVGTVRARREVAGTPRSAQIVEDGAKRWLHVQYGEKTAPPKDPQGASEGLDSGVTHTLTDTAGGHWERPDTSVLLKEARALDRHRTKCCTRRSRRWRALLKRASALRKRIAGVQHDAECHIAQTLSQGSNVVGMENLSLRNMSASGKGTTSVPGSRKKHSLNEGLARARLGRLHHAIERRCLKDGTWCVKVHPGGTSITCSRCEHRNPGSRKGERFECTACGHTAHADQNAAVNIEARTLARLDDFLARRTIGDGDRRRDGQGRVRDAPARRAAPPAGGTRHTRARSAERAPHKARYSLDKSIVKLSI